MAEHRPVATGLLDPDDDREGGQVCWDCGRNRLQSEEECETGQCHRCRIEGFTDALELMEGDDGDTAQEGDKCEKCGAHLGAGEVADRVCLGCRRWLRERAGTTGPSG